MVTSHFWRVQGNRMSSGEQIIGTVAGGVIGFFVGGPTGAFYGASIGFGIGTYASLETQTIKAPKLSDLSVQTSSFGVPLGRCYGTVPISGNIFWLENNKLKEVVKKKKQGGKGGGGGTEVETKSYYATFAVALADTSKTGPILGV